MGSVRGARRGRLGGSGLLLLHKLVSDAGILGLRRRTEGLLLFLILSEPSDDEEDGLLRALSLKMEDRSELRTCLLWTSTRDS